jgi:signal transduction histidine kinase
VSTVAVAAAVVAGAGAALGGGLVLQRWLRRVRSLRRQVLAVTLASLAAGAVVAVVLARLMVLDAGEVRLVVGVLALTAGFATILVLTASAPLGRDVRRLESTVRALEDGDRQTRTGVVRADELGHVATALDAAIARLDALERQRVADDQARSAMFSSVSHDLRTPLSALRAALEAIEDGVTPDPPRYLRSMQRDVDALTSLVDDLFLLARIESGALEMVPRRVDLAEIADDAAEALSPMADVHGVTLRVAVGEQVLVLGDPVALGRIIRNLVDNAIRHSPAGSVVAIDVTADQRPTVRVLDEGEGFPAEFTRRAFDRFTRADPSRSRTTGGTGLGLAIAQGLVEAHGGEIWIDEAPGGSVSFALPAPS